MSGTHVSFQATPTTIGRLLAGDALAVPRFQREYSWTPDEVDKLLRDFSRAMRNQQFPYFLGSIVLAAADPLEVVDGQQRLATCSIIFAVLRDLLLKMGREPQAKSIEEQYLQRTDFEVGKVSSRLTLNVDDRGFFWQCIVCRPDDEARRIVVPRFESHSRLQDASACILEWIEGDLNRATDDGDRLEIIGRWRAFLHDNAVVASLIAKSRQQAFRMFVTLNDRGLQVSQADLVKNHLFEKAQESFEVVQSAWTQMRSTLEALDVESSSLDFLRHFLAMRRGLVREEDIFAGVESEVANETDAVTFAESLAVRANDFTAILTPSHSYWKKIPKGGQLCRKRLSVLNDELGVKFHRSLLLAVVVHFEPPDVVRAIAWITSLAARLLIVGGSRSGKTEEGIAAAAQKIGSREIATAEKLADYLQHVMPSDVLFREAFAEKRIDKPRIARYVLRSIESKKREEEFPETTVIDDADVVSLEHILPKKRPPDPSGWDHFSVEEHRAYATRLGNYALMHTLDNSSSGQASFQEKRKVFEKSAGNLLTTRDIVDHTTPESSWTTADIDLRQVRLADDALHVWPFAVPK